MLRGGAGPLPWHQSGYLRFNGFATHQLAYMLDSVVRVSRRADWAPSASILRPQIRENPIRGGLQSSVGKETCGGGVSEEHARPLSLPPNPC